MFNRDFIVKASKACFLSLIGLLFVQSAAFGQSDQVDFAKSIKPIFEKHCIGCHGPDKEESFRIDEKDSAMDFIEVDSAEDSLLYEVLVSDDEEELMPPPDEKNPLSEKQVELVKAWIDSGADWPDGIEMVSTAPVAEPAADEKDEKSKDDDDGGDEKPAKVDPKTQRIFNAIGSLHPAAIHLPIGLLLAAGLFALFSLRGNFVMSDCAYYCLWLGTLGAIVACVSGWWFSPMENRGTVTEVADLLNQDHKIFWHRTGALIATVFAFLLALFAAGARNRDPDDGVMWKLGLILLAAGIGWVGHEGGELTHGADHYKDLEAIGADLLPGVFGDPEAPPKAEKAKEPDDESADDEVGKASDET